MATKTKIDRGLYSIEKMISRYKDEAHIKITNEVVIVNEKKSEMVGTALYILLLIVGPIILLLASLDYSEKWKLTIISVAPLIFGWNLYRMTIGNNILFIDLKAKQLKRENLNPIFKKLFGKKIIPFEELTKVEIVEQTIRGKYSSTIWHQLIVTDKQNNKIALTDFDLKFPHSFIARKVEFLINQIIDTYGVRLAESG